METVIDLSASSGATVRFDDGFTPTAAELAEEGCRVASWLAAAGCRRGDRVAIRLTNCPDYLRLLLGCAAGGFVTVSVNTRYGDDEAGDLIARSGARVLALDDGWRWHEPIDPIGGTDDPFVVFTTSGTTSKPKMVLHRQRSIVDHAVDAATGTGYRSDDVVMVAMPLCGTFGLTSLTAAVAAGSAVIVTDYDTTTTAALITEYAVSCINGSDDMFHRLLEHGADLSSIRLAGYARFNTSLDGVVDRADSAGATLTGLYGMSEVQALYTVRDPAGPTNERERAGGTLISAGASFRVVDGELQLGPSLFAGYLEEGGDRIDDELTARHVDDGWFRTGDHAEVDDDRTFHYVARMGDALRLGGFLVAPTEVESVLIELDSIRAAQVVAIDRPGGARPVAFVVAPDGVDEGAAIEHCRTRIARYKVPVRVVAVEEFPTTDGPNGRKIQKAKLREMAARLLA